MEAQAFITAANNIVAAGISLVPTGKNKKTFINQWKPLQSRLPTPQEIKAWSTSNELFGIAAVAGKISGNIQTIDVDSKYDLTGKLWDEFCHLIKEQSPELFKKLVIAKTTNGGYHVIVRVPPEVTQGNQKLAQRPATDEERAAGDKVKVLLETRGEGGYFIVQPTPGYEFIQGDISSITLISKAEYDLLLTIAKSFDEMPVRSEPAQPKQETRQSSGDLSPFDDYNERADVPALIDQYGWKYAYRQGDRLHFRRPGQTDSKTSGNWHERLRIFFVFSTSTEFESEKGYNPTQVYTMLAHNGDFSAAGKALYEAGYGTRRNGKASEPATEAESAEEFSGQMPEPLPNELLPVPKFDEHLLPESVRGLVSDTADRMQSPIEFIAGAVIVAAASLIGNVVRIAPKRHDNWIVTPNLWGALIALPGKLKTPALQAGLSPLKMRESLSRSDYAEELKSFDFDKLQREAEREAVKGKLKEAAKKGENTERFRSEFETLGELEPPTPKTYLVNDVTVEKLGVLLNRNPRGVMLFRDELIGFLRNLDKEENGEDKAFMLECWNGFGSYTFDRITRGETRVENLTLSILGGIQPGVLASYLRNAIAGGEFDDGFIQRFQMAFYPDSTKWKLVDRPPNQGALDLANNCFAKLDKLTDEESNGTVLLRFDDEAQVFFYEWWTELEGDIENGVFEHPALVAHFSKYRSLMPSLALIFHLFDVVAIPGEVDQIPAVSLDAAMKAAAWCELLAEHARRIYGIAIRPETTQARTILQKIKQGKLAGKFTAREIWRNQWTGLQSSEDCVKPLQILVDHGYLRPLSVSTTDKGGRPTTEYFVHPSLLDEQEAQS